MESEFGKSGALPPGHVPDLLRPGLKLVFCGTALGRVSAQRRAYYAHPGNLFWRTLHETGLTPERVAPADYARLLEWDIGLTDLSKRYFGNDSDLPGDAFDSETLRDKLRHYRPKTLAFTSKKAASMALNLPTGRISPGEQTQSFDETKIFVLPSPSGLARGYWDITPWQDLAHALRR